MNDYATDDPVEGLWRDGEFLVVDHTSACFPNRCIWTGERVDSQPSELLVHYRPKIGWRITLMRGLHSGFGETLDGRILLPMSDSWKGARDERVEAVGKGLLHGGLACIMPIVLLGLFVGFYQPDQKSTMGIAIMATTGFLGAFAIIGIVVGLAWPHLEGVPHSRKTPSEVPFLGERYVWIPNADHGLLNSLPVWDGTPLSQCIPTPVSFFGALRKDFVTFVIVIIVFVAMAAAGAVLRRL